LGKIFLYGKYTNGESGFDIQNAKERKRDPEGVGVVKSKHHKIAGLDTYKLTL